MEEAAGGEGGEAAPPPLLHPRTGHALPHLSIVHKGLPRYFALVSRSPDPIALVVLLHGYRSSASAMYQTWERLVDSSRFVVLLPEGLKGASPHRSWNAVVCCGYALKHKADDVGFVRAMVEHVWKANATLARLRNKAFVVGSSNGAFLTQLIALNAERGIPGFDFVAGAVSVAGVQWDSALFPPPPSKRGLPLLILHGQNDKSVNFTGCCHEQPLAEKCCCSISQHSAVPCVSTLAIYQRWKCLHGCQQNVADDYLALGDDGYLLSALACSVSTKLGVFPKANHSLIQAVPGIELIAIEFIRHEACLQLGGAGCSSVQALPGIVDLSDASGAQGEDAVGSAAGVNKGAVLVVVLVFSLALWVVVRLARRRRQGGRWELVPTN